jgi:cob(I)alamin adenosyltransferase
MTEQADKSEAEHRAKMQRIKSARDKMMAEKSGGHGLLIVNTGKGKGKSSAAWGMVMRCLGHSMRVGIVQFIKGAWSTGEADFLKRFPELVTIKTMGEGFTWETQDRARDVAAAGRAWEAAKAMMADEGIRLLVLDEINIALRYDYIDVAEVVRFLKEEKPHMTHVVLTGRNAKEDLIEIADLVTEMELVKHPFRSGIKGQKGVEF